MSLKNDDGNSQRLLAPDNNPHRPPGERSKCPRTWKFAVVVFIVFALFLVGVVVGFYISQTFEPYRSAPCRDSTWPGAAQGSRNKDLVPSDDDDPVQLGQLHESVVDFVSTVKPVMENVAVFTDYQLHSGHDLDLELVDLLQEHFNSCRFDDLGVEHYDVLISLPNPNRPSRLLAFDKLTNQTVIETDFKSLINAGSLPGFVAYSPNASVEGELIYLNHGTFDDFSQEANKGLEGKIGLVQTGQSTLEEKVHLAVCHGLIGLLIVEDSHEFHGAHSKHHLCSDVTPYAVFHIPPGGDPSTPSFPSIDGVWRLPLSEIKLPKIPVQTVSCETARILLDHLQRSSTPESFGDGESLGTMVLLEVSNELVYKPIQNVIATLYGDKDSDFSILVGANRNSFDTGSSGGIPGTEVLIKVSSAISQLFHREVEPLWIPRRTIRFVSWGGSDFGYLGFTEFLEKYHGIWRNKLVAYIDLDSPSKVRRHLESDVGDRVVVTSSASVEVLTDMIIKQLNGKDRSIPESIWLSVAKKPSAVGHHSADICPATLLRSYLPAPYIHLQVTAVSDDAEDASEESPSSRISSQIASLLTLTLADSGVFHFQVHQTARETIADVNKLITKFSAVIPNVTIEAIHSQLKRLKKSTVEFEDYIHRHLEYDKPEYVRMANSALLQFEAEMTSIQVDVAKMQAQHSADHSQCVAMNNLCSNSTNPEIQLVSDISELLSRLTATTKVTDLAG